MEKIQLTVKNCHRAKRVMNDAISQDVVWAWNYKPNADAFGCSMSEAFNENTGAKVEVKNIDMCLNDWNVVEWKYEENFEDLYKMAYDSFCAISHSPERRALDMIRSYEKLYLDDTKDMPEEMKADYFDKFRAKLITIIGKQNRIMSAAIVGPARFPVERNRKAQESYEKTIEEFESWRKSCQKKIEAMKEAAKTPEEKFNEAWISAKRLIDRYAGTVFQIDTKKVVGYNRSLFVSSLYGKLETLSKNLDPDVFTKVMEYLKETGDTLKAKGGKPIFTSRHKVWNLEEVAKARRVKEEEKANRGDVEIEFEGGTVVKNYGEDRLQIFHDEKPSRDVINNLKHHGFRWSPTNGCWQRLLNSQSMYAASKVITSLSYEQISSAV